jgi:hypothetical protein
LKEFVSTLRACPRSRRDRTEQRGKTEAWLGTLRPRREARCSTRSNSKAPSWVSGLAALSPGTSGKAALVPTSRSTSSPEGMLRVPYSVFTSTVLGARKRGHFCGSCAPLAVRRVSKSWRSVRWINSATFASKRAARYLSAAPMGAGASLRESASEHARHLNGQCPGQ